MFVKMELCITLVLQKDDHSITNNSLIWRQIIFSSVCMLQFAQN